MLSQRQILLSISLLLCSSLPQSTHSFLISSSRKALVHHSINNSYLASASTDEETPTPKAEPRPSAGLERTHEEPEEVIIRIAPKAMIRLQELRKQQNSEEIILRMGVRNGGCSGLSYAMDFSTRDEVQDDDSVDEYTKESIACVVDSKSLLYLYGLELDYSDELIGGGFKFFNPNAEESCGCGSSFGV